MGVERDEKVFRITCQCGLKGQLVSEDVASMWGGGSESHELTGFEPDPATSSIRHQTATGWSVIFRDMKARCPSCGSSFEAVEPTIKPISTKYHRRPRIYHD